MMRTGRSHAEPSAGWSVHVRFSGQFRAATLRLGGMPVWVDR
jgi:hypothetical protein